MDEGYFTERRQKFQDALAIRQRHKAEANQLAALATGPWVNTVNQQLQALNAMLAFVGLQYHPAMGKVNNIHKVGELRVPIFSNQYSNESLEPFILKTQPARLIAEFKFGGKVIGTRERGEVTADELFRLLVDHAFRCLERSEGLDTPIRDGD